MRTKRSCLSVSNFPLAYRLSWLPRLLKPSLAGDRRGFAPPAATWLGPVPAPVARLVFVGDMSAVANRSAPVFHPSIRDLLASADLVVGNCESPVVERAKRPFGTALGFRHAMGERFVTETLDAAGVARGRLVLSVANNHALDQGAAGFDETLATLRRLGVRVAGLAGETVAKVAVRAAASELTIGLLAFTQWRNAGREAYAGRVCMADDRETRPSDETMGCDLLCVLPHWDWEFRHFPRAETRALARRLAEGGARLIVGGHAHVVQPVERMRDTLVAYGLGDFLGTAWTRQPWPGRIGAVLSVDVGLDGDARGRIAAYRFHPFFRLPEAGREHLVPLEALEEELRSKAIERLAALSGRDATA